MEPEPNSDQTIWEVAKKACREAWGTKTSYTGRVCVGITVFYWEKYLDRFGQFPPGAIREQIAIDAVKLQKIYPKIIVYREINEQNLINNFDGERTHTWGENKVSDFDN